MSLLMKELETSSFLRGKYEVKSFRKEEIILNAEDRLDSIIILKSGKLKTYSLSENGAKHLMRIYEAGGLLGDVIKREHFLKWMEHDFNISLYIVRQLAEKLINTGIKMRSAVSYPLKYQVLLYIWKYVSQYKNNCIPKVLIVEELGSNIRSINRILKQLAEEGIIINLSGKIKIEDLNLVLTMMSQYELC